MDFTTTTGDGSIAPVLFTYDPNTELFTGLLFVWTFDGHSDDFDLVNCVVCSDFGLNTHMGHVNLLTSSGKASVLANLLAGGLWNTLDTIIFQDSDFILGAINIRDLGGSSNTTAGAGGTFTTTAVPEPLTAVLLIVGLASWGIASVQQRFTQTS
jgi:hypothetical protein